MKKLYFIRHGESEGNVKRIFSGRLDLPLTELGRNQARKASANAKNLKIDCIVSSPLCRASETAEIVAEAIGYPKDKIILTDLLTERSYGDMHGEPYEEVDGIDFNAVSNIETDSQLIERAKLANEFLKTVTGDSVLICGHGTSGRALRSHVLNQPIGDIEVTLEDEIPNAVIVTWI